MSSREDEFCQARIAFQGRIVADATHEIQNHFAVIKEYKGLISDLLQSKPNDMDSCVKRCREISGNINERARLAAEMVETLNRFTHRGDVAVSRFRVEQVVEDLVSLMQRSASRKRITLEAAHGRKVPEVANDPSLIQFLVYSLIAPIVEALPEEGRIRLSTQRGKGKMPEITLASEGGDADLVEQELMAPELLSSCLDRLQGSYLVEDAGRKRPKILLSITSLS
ncbi:MAG: hypothetical protein Q7K29_00125 [Thermoleophilia bacterium]|nr:hypothetical protein [Thermoleophilia bacterium]